MGLRFPCAAKGCHAATGRLTMPGLLYEALSSRESVMCVGRHLKSEVFLKGVFLQREHRQLAVCDEARKELEHEARKRGLDW